MAYISALLASAAFLGSAMAQDSTNSTEAPKNEKEFPLVWICLGITVVGVIIAFYVAYRRPDEFHLPGSTVMVATESEAVGTEKEPTKNRGSLNDDLEAV